MHSRSYYDAMEGKSAPFTYLHVRHTTLDASRATSVLVAPWKVLLDRFFLRLADGLADPAPFERARASAEAAPALFDVEPCIC